MLFLSYHKYCHIVCIVEIGKNEIKIDCILSFEESCAIAGEVVAGAVGEYPVRLLNADAHPLPLLRGGVEVITAAGEDPHIVAREPELGAQVRLGQTGAVPGLPTSAETSINVMSCTAFFYEGFPNQKLIIC